MRNDRTSDRMLMLLKTRGEMTTRVLADALDISVPAVRQHLKAQADLVRMESRSKGVGRPAQVWTLSEAAHGRFPDTHSELTVKLIDTIEQTMGETGLQAIIDARYRESLHDYQARLKGVRSLSGRLNRLVKIRSEEGYMASLDRHGDSWLLVENHCPICAAATRCQGFCTNELKLFKTLLGDTVQIDREEYLLQGGQRCAYRIRRKSA